jgi:membrane protease YdiL (CAAX protease family)
MHFLASFLVLFGLSLIALLVAFPWPPDLIAFLLGGAVCAALIALGLLAARPFGRGATLVERVVRRESWLSTHGRALVLAPLIGLGVGALLLALLAALAGIDPGLGTRLAARAGQPIWMPLTLAVEASVLEELIFRLFLMSGLVWLLTRVLRPGPSGPSRAVVWAAVTASALAFGLAHLPSWMALANLTPFIIAVVLLLNGIGGLALGQVYWRWGIEAAILCHFVGDVVVQGIGPRLFGS